MVAATRNIGVSLGQIGSLSDGLGEFSTQICEHIAALAASWREQHDVQFHLHMPAQWHGRFGREVSYLATHKLQGHWHWQGLRRFDVWHGLNQLGRIGPPIGTRHSLLTIHDLNPIYHDTERESGKALRKLRSRLSKFDEVTTLTRYVEGDIRRHLAWAGPVTVIPNGARDLTAHAQQVVDGLAPGSFVLHLSRMAASKNPQCLVELAAAWPEQQVVLAGPRNGDSDRLLAQAQARGLNNLHVVQEVNDEQKTWLYANCLVFAFPSLTEGFGLPPLEAMHFGKPVFLSRLTSLPEVGGDRAAYFDSFEPLAMRRVFESQLPRLLGESAALRAHAAQFTWDAAAQAYLAIYQRMLAAP
ncbi:MAG: glycosyltransferase family 1 protein [Rhizobacter sp.]